MRCSSSRSKVEPNVLFLYPAFHCRRRLLSI